MKRLLFGISLLIYIHTNLLGQNTPDLNITYGIPSIRSITPLSPTAYSESAQGTTFKSDSIMDAIQYLDGLGRPIQVIQRGATPSHKDLVTYQEYDVFGRESKSWLPSVSSNKGAFIPLDIIEQNTATSYKDGAAYGIPLYEASPLNRVTEQYGPGQKWYESSKAVKTEYKTNIGTSGEYSCQLFIVTGDGMNTSLTKKGYYDNGELNVTKVTDEEGNISYGFKDKLGRMVLTRHVNDSKYYDTYYVFDNSGNQSFVIPPIIAEKAISVNLSQEDIDKYGYQYKYDKRGRCVQKQLPGANPVRFIYDKADRLIFTQDGEQRKDGKNEWTFTISDVLGRNVLTGICKNADITNEKYEKLLVIAEDKVKEKGTYRGYNILINGVATTLTSPEILTVNYYDNYNFLGEYMPSDWTYTSKEGYGVHFTGDNKGYETKGLLTGTSVALLDGSDKLLHSVSYYDNRGRVVQTISKNHLDGEEKNYFDYNYTNQVIRHLHEHIVKSKDKQTEFYTYSYDHAGRLTKTEHSVNGVTPIVLAENKYNRLGQLESSTSNNKAELKTSYSYNIRSWTTNITTGKLFKEVLGYTYSGNIENMLWKQDTDTKDRSYTFEYDQLSRLTNAKYTGIANEDYSSTYSYDLHGNMKTLTRMGMVNNKPELIDDLSFDYTGNQMLNVEDAIQGIMDNSSMDFKDYNKKAGIPIEYTYNANGAMIMDLNKGIQNIKYNILNLPQEVEIAHETAKARNYYTYTATGTKLKVVHQNDALQKGAPVGAGSQENQIQTIDYVGNMIYEDGILDKILLDNGYYQDGNYYFYVRDHLGNNRLVTDAAASVVQSNHYYPFGISFAESTGQEKQPYKYNNKELDDRAGLNWYDYSARMKDDWGFTTQDPHSENYYSWSPYVYVGNNPMNLIDPNGKDWVYRVVDGVHEIYYDRSVRSQDDVNIKYGSDGGVTHLATGATATISQNGEVTSQYTFFNDPNDTNQYGTVLDQNGNLMADNQIISGSSYNIFGTSDDSVNAETLHKNTYGSYFGKNNPKDYNKNDSYQYVPTDPLDYSAYLHDLGYREEGISGPNGVFDYQKGYLADKLLYANAAKVARNSTSFNQFKWAMGAYLLFKKTATMKEYYYNKENTYNNMYTPNMPYYPF
uniref:DUF6443 domain-containing protein n=1 Tax=uncultured Dysgonomonas sp. TaxID=206096 RepID=UPI00262782BB|nr:DUF6443 domain-containing protein [uncultured Dysgonomonas sp.]